MKDADRMANCVDPDQKPTDHYSNEFILLLNKFPRRFLNHYIPIQYVC